MKINKEKVGKIYSHKLENDRGVLQFGFYKSGLGFVAVNGQVGDVRTIAVEMGMSEPNARVLPVREIIKWFIFKFGQ